MTSTATATRSSWSERRSAPSAGATPAARVPDLGVGSHLASGTDRARGGIAYLVFGKTDTAGQDAAKLGDGGYRIAGVSPHDQTGAARSGCGNVTRAARSAGRVTKLAHTASFVTRRNRT